MILAHKKATHFKQSGNSLKFGFNFSSLFQHTMENVETLYLPFKAIDFYCFNGIDVKLKGSPN